VVGGFCEPHNCPFDYLMMTSFLLGAFRLRNRLSKALPSVALAASGLVAGASLLSGGEAKAFSCSFGPGGTCDTNIWHDSNPVATDKQILFKTLPSPTITGQTIAGDIKFDWVDINGNTTWDELADLKVDQWHVNVDFNPINLMSADGQSNFDYIMKITNPSLWFYDVFLGSVTSPTAPPGGLVSKQLFHVDHNGSTDPTLWTQGALITAIMDNTGTAILDPLHLQEIWVSDTALANVNGSVDNYQNSFRQVPGPLPLLGAGAAFGYTRKLRRRLKATRLA
jgi:hypothetical protein